MTAQRLLKDDFSVDQPLKFRVRKIREIGGQPGKIGLVIVQVFPVQPLAFLGEGHQGAPPVFRVGVRVTQPFFSSRAAIWDTAPRVTSSFCARLLTEAGPSGPSATRK